MPPRLADQDKRPGTEGYEGEGETKEEGGGGEGGEQPWCVRDWRGVRRGSGGNDNGKQAELGVGGGRRRRRGLSNTRTGPPGEPHMRAAAAAHPLAPHPPYTPARPPARPPTAVQSHPRQDTPPLLSPPQEINVHGRRSPYPTATTRPRAPGRRPLSAEPPLSTPPPALGYVALRRLAREERARHAASSHEAGGGERQTPQS